MTIKRYNTMDLMRSVMDDMAWKGLDSFIPKTFTYGGTLVDTEKYDIVPKPGYLETLINNKQGEIDALDANHATSEEYYKRKRAKLIEEKETLIKDRYKRNKRG